MDIHIKIFFLKKNIVYHITQRRWQAKSTMAHSFQSILMVEAMVEGEGIEKDQEVVLVTKEEAKILCQACTLVDYH